jgi:Kazal-type serine protease inhibitor domain
MNRTLAQFVPLTALCFALAFSACSDDTTPTPSDATVGDDSTVGDQSVGTDSASDMAVTPDQAVTTDQAIAPDKAVALDKAVAPDKGQPPKDLGPGGCTTNANCASKSQFCNLKLGCVAPGVCKTKPTMCASIYAPVCGCDNKTYSNSCMANASGTSVKSKGVCSSVKTCTQIRTEYTTAITAAKKCSPILPVVQCKAVVTKELACGCLTAVSATNATAYAQILSLTALWKSQACDKQPWNCPKMPCKSVSTGKCDSTTKTCVDVP